MRPFVRFGRAINIKNQICLRRRMPGNVNADDVLPQTLNTLAQPSFLILGYLYRPYTAHTLAGRLTYGW